MLLTAHVRWLQTGPTYDGNVGVARFPDFSPMRKLEIWCEICFGHSLVIVFPGRKLLGLPHLPMEHPLTQTGLLAYPKVVLHRLPRSQTVRQYASAKRPIQIGERPARRSTWPSVLARYSVHVHCTRPVPRDGSQGRPTLENDLLYSRPIRKKRIESICGC